LEYTGISIIIAMPGTVDTDLRSSALDADPVLSARIKKPSMKPDECARLIVNASDKRRRQIYLPWYYRPLFWFNVYFPEIVDSFTAKMYGYSKKSS
jgi:short-subunit dehydrogenase